MGQYIPDITERFPEGFGGVDMTDTYFGGRARGGYLNEAELIGYGDLPDEIETPGRFEVGDRYFWTDWFSGGQSHYVVIERTPDRVTFAEHRTEMDGEYDETETFKIFTDEDDNEYVKMCEYHGEEGRMYADIP